jgi:hypothetical protein
MIDFEEGVSAPESWFRQSWEMFEASKVLYAELCKRSPIRSDKDNYRNVGSMKAAMLLLGLAAENALKGAVVYRSKPDLSNDQLKSKHFHEHAHNLIEISKKLNLNLSDAQIDLLERLTIFVQWASKYQAPLTKREHQSASGRIKLNPSDYQQVEDLIHQLQKVSGFDETNGWPSRS